MSAATRSTDAGDYAIGDGTISTSVSLPKSIVPVVGPVFGIPAKLEPFVLLAKSARGGGVADLVIRAISAPGVYVFAELLDVKTIQDLATSEKYKGQHELLEIFAYGTWSDYAANKDHLPTLTPAQSTKLRHLTILSLARESRIIPYATLLSTLDLPSIPVLEDLLIEAFYSNVMSGRLDQREGRLEVITSLGRDVRPITPTLGAGVALPLVASGEEVAMELDSPITTSTPHTNSITTLTTSLQDFLTTISTLLQSLNQHLAHLTTESINETYLATEHDREVHRIVQEVIVTNTSHLKEGSGMGGNLGGWKENLAGLGKKLVGTTSSGSGSGSGGSGNGGLAGLLSPRRGEGEAMEVDFMAGTAGASGGGGAGMSARQNKRGRIDPKA